LLTVASFLEDQADAMNDGAPNPLEVRMLRMLRRPDVTATLLSEVMDDPPSPGRRMTLEQTEAVVLLELPLGEQQRYWEQMETVNTSQRLAYQRQAWRYALLKIRLAS
jgi:hypothetical protein